MCNQKHLFRNISKSKLLVKNHKSEAGQFKLKFPLGGGGAILVSIFWLYLQTFFEMYQIVPLFAYEDVLD